MGTWLLIATAVCLVSSASSYHVIEGSDPLLEGAENVNIDHAMLCYVFASELDVTLSKNPFPEFLCLCSWLVVLKADVLPTGFVSVENPTMWKGLMHKILMVRMRIPHLKVVVSLRGSASYSMISRSPMMMLQFSRNLALWKREYFCDGFEIDWQYPGIGPGSSLMDKKNLPLLLRALERELDKANGDANLILRVGSQPSLLSTSYIPKELGNFAEFVVIDVLDMHDSTLGTTGFNSPLYYKPGDQDMLNNVDAIVKLWKKAGVSPDKLVLNIPVFGATYKLEDPAEINCGAPTLGPGPPSWHTQEAGVMSFKEICDLVTNKQNEWETIYDQFAMVPYSTDKKTWVSHENMKSVTSKALYVDSNDLAGVGVYTIDSDDDEGTCYQLRYPLLNTILEIMEPKRFLACRNMNLYANVTALSWQQAMSPLGPMRPRI